jgi:predicted nucleic acid-binding protein
MNLFDVVGINYEKLVNSLNDTTFDDIEDCLQSECAEEINADYIITRDPEGFINSSVKVVFPEEFLQILGKNKIEN